MPTPTNPSYIMPSSHYTYKVLSVGNAEELERKLNELAADGWEIAPGSSVSVAMYPSHPGVWKTYTAVMRYRALR